MKFQLTEDFCQRIRARHRKEAEPWLANLPDTIGKICEEHEVELIRQHDSYEAIVLEGLSPGLGAVVAKFGHPTRFLQSIRASRMFAEHGGVPVLAACEKRGVLLTRKIEPGATLLSIFQKGNDDHATELAAATIVRLRSVGVPAANAFRHGNDFAVAFDQKAEKIPLGVSTLIPRAKAILAELLQDDRPLTLLHGDLHHDNIVIDADGAAYVIDPKGIIADPAYEVGAWMRNPMDLYDNSDPSMLLRRRFDIFCNDLGEDRERLRAWSFVQMCLAAIGLFEDEQKAWPRAFEFAERLLRA